MPEYTKENHWYSWDGECIKPPSLHDETIIDFVWHDENTGKCGLATNRMVGYDNRDTCPAWRNILKFRIIKLHREPREFWITNNDAYAHDSLVEALKSPHVCKHGYIHVREVVS